AEAARNPGQNIKKIGKLSIKVENCEPGHAEYQPGEQRMVLSHFDAKAAQQLGGEIPKSGAGGDQSRENKDIARPVDADRRGLQSQPSVDQWPGVADE